MAKDCTGCGEALCGRCEQCHLGALCLWSVPPCQPAPMLTGDEQRVAALLLRRRQRLQRLVERVPHTVEELRELQITADVFLMAAFDEVATLLHQDLRTLIEQVLALHEQVWNLPLVIVKRQRGKEWHDEQP